MLARVQERACRLDEDYPSTRCTALRCHDFVYVVVRIRSFNNSWRYVSGTGVAAVTALSRTEILIVSSGSGGAIYSAPERRMNNELKESLFDCALIVLKTQFVALSISVNVLIAMLFNYFILS